MWGSSIFSLNTCLTLCQHIICLPILLAVYTVIPKHCENEALQTPCTDTDTRHILFNLNVLLCIYIGYILSWQSLCILSMFAMFPTQGRKKGCIRMRNACIYCFLIDSMSLHPIFTHILVN